MLFGFATAAALLCLYSYTQNMASSPVLISIVEFLANTVFSVGLYFFVVGHANAVSVLKRLSPEVEVRDKSPVIFPIFQRALTTGLSAFFSAIIVAILLKI